MSVRFTEAEIAEVWQRPQPGELTRSIGRRWGRNGSSIRRVLEGCVRHRGGEPSGSDRR